MRKKFVALFVSMLMVFVSLPVVALAFEPVQRPGVDIEIKHVCSVDCDHNVVMNDASIEAILEMLNAGYIFPEYMIVEQFVEYTKNCCGLMLESANGPDWPHTQCSNILGHSWSAWTSWTGSAPPVIHHPNCRPGGPLVHCTATFRRNRFCLRTNCGRVQTEHMTLSVRCH